MMGTGDLGYSSELSNSVLLKND
eukprot:UN10552